jgi:aryl-alcohol dehydrogenase-like predicted oxidoreductase
VALAWLQAQEEVTAIVVGPTRPEQLEPVAEALELKVPAVELAQLTEVFA